MNTRTNAHIHTQRLSWMKDVYTRFVALIYFVSLIAFTRNFLSLSLPSLFECITRLSRLRLIYYIPIHFYSFSFIHFSIRCLLVLIRNANTLQYAFILTEIVAAILFYSYLQSIAQIIWHLKSIWFVWNSALSIDKQAVTNATHGWFVPSWFVHLATYLIQ